MMERSFIKRMMKLKLLNSLDTFGFVLSLISLLFIQYYTNWSINFLDDGNDILDVFITISSTFFAFILTGFTVITSFTDKNFIRAWIEIGEYEGIITLFQYNLYIPMTLLIVSFILRFVYYNSIVMIFLISLFVYMILSIADLVKFISNYALQRGDFIVATNEKSE